MVTCAGTAHAQPASDGARSGFEILVNAGYGASTGKVRNVQIQPYGAGLGLDIGYLFRSGFRLGAMVGYGLGRSVAQHHDGPVGNDFDFTSDASSLSFGLSLSYDVPIDSLVLRYALNVGGTVMSWDFEGVPPDSVLGSDVWLNPTSSLLLAPGLVLWWPRGALQWGIGFDYYVQASGTIPSGFLAKLLFGVRL